MAVGKNKKLGKRKGGKKKYVDPFTKKDWYTIKAPAPFKVRNVGVSPVNRTVGTKKSVDSLLNRVFEVSAADLEGTETQFFRKIKLRCEAVQGKELLTSFDGLSFTTDKSRSLVRKWQTLIEAHVDVKTSDGYLLRLFCIAFTKRRPNQIRKTSYAQAAQVKQIRKKMFEVIKAEVANVELKDLVSKLIATVIGSKIEKATQMIYPLQNTYIRKVKVLQRPKFDTYKLNELHADESGSSVSRPAGQKITNLLDDEGASAPKEVVGLE
eukprot:Plantae.Rhodophyta-Palmaria_palmata.ctg6451.p1 GENE.Plantae.Rhodophyta-Palmaria_palmata.ctg6451~~Plantae.Rhodophyta-Palmaria_palmata.ctg6451.p1  ORF type:complete len:267 (-),score=55.83 Plantae.Rhodophyta-Palmaria_palmata.ctg6451:28-828(-)